MDKGLLYSRLYVAAKFCVDLDQMGPQMDVTMCRVGPKKLSINGDVWVNGKSLDGIVKAQVDRALKGYILGFVWRDLGLMLLQCIYDQYLARSPPRC